MVHGPRPLPLLLSHGWPDLSWQFTKLIPLLTNPSAHGGRAEDAFDVVVPDLPGFGFSAPLPPTGPYAGQTASRLQHLLTTTLGYARYGAHGSDIGSLITERLALEYAPSLRGMHLTGVPFTRLFVPPTDPSAEEQAYLTTSLNWLTQHAVYVTLQGREPNTLVPDLRYSPTGLAAWLLDKSRAWSDCGGDLESRFSQDELLTNLTLYWATDTIGSSFAPYSQADQVPQGLGAPKIEVPTGFTTFAHNLLRAPRVFAERFYKVRQWAEVARGGHFPAPEEPEALATSLRAFFRPLRWTS
jgi:pimeloyl-ACP methyl ester carboxylesterase